MPRAVATVRSLKGGVDDAIAATDLAEAELASAHPDASQRGGRTHPSKGPSPAVEEGTNEREAGCQSR
jgi:hypothetical protein